MSEEVITNFEGPGQEENPPSYAQGDDVEEIELDISLVNQETDDTALWDQIPDCTGREITIPERDNILVQMAEILSGRKNVQARLNLLNAKGVPMSLKPMQYGGEWERKNSRTI